jgi:hypothetical protein
MTAFKRFIIDFLKKENSSFADFAETDKEIVYKLTDINIDTETGKVYVSFPNPWIDQRETVVISTIELIGFICTKIEEKDVCISN